MLKVITIKAVTFYIDDVCRASAVTPQGTLQINGDRKKVVENFIKLQEYLDPEDITRAMAATARTMAEKIEEAQQEIRKLRQNLETNFKA